MRRILGEPLLHFLLMGAALFAAYGWLHRDDAAGRDPYRVHVRDRDVQWLAQAWKQQWHREPSREELREVVTQFVREEVLAREARELGLDRSDTVVRRVLAQKVEFLLRDTIPSADPSEADLRRLYASGSGPRPAQPQLTMTQVFFDGTRPDAASDARSALARLRGSASAGDAGSLGDPLLVPATLRDVDETTLAGQLGRDFAQAVFALEPGAWHGPIASAYGLHLVRVSDRVASARPAYEEARPRLLDTWREQQARAEENRRLARLWSKYDIEADDGVQLLVGDWKEGRPPVARAGDEELRP